MTPSGATRHHALSVSTGDRPDADFDFLAQPPGYRRNLVPFKWVFRTCTFLVLLLLLILVIVDVSRVNRRRSTEISLENARCFFPLEGGKTAYGFNLPQKQIFTPSCLKLFKEYFKDSGQYWTDTEDAIAAGRFLLRKGNYNQMVVLDIDETSLSNLPLYKEREFQPNKEERRSWWSDNKAPAIPATLEFYKELRGKGFAVAFITGRRNGTRQSTMQNLQSVGYGPLCTENPPPKGEVCYFKLVMREDDDKRDAVIYKSEERKKLIDEGIELIGSVGDQWSDLIGTDRPVTLIKLPNPLYYIP